MSSVSDDQAGDGSIQYYRAEAEHCRQQAERAVEVHIRQKYLDFADQWDWMARQAERSNGGKLR